MIKIKQAQGHELPVVREVCVAASDAEVEDEILYLRFCDYYVLCQPASCFVAVNELGDTVGYVLSAEARLFLKDFPRVFMTRLGSISLREYVRELKHASQVRRMARHGYGYHLYINVLPEWQNKGIGGALMKELLRVLKASGADGVWCSVPKNNINAMETVTHYGFRARRKSSKRQVMAQKLK